MTADPFVAHRGLLFTVAYEMLGSAADAEDVLQEAWLRWDRAGGEPIENVSGWLTTVVTRICPGPSETMPPPDCQIPAPFWAGLSTHMAVIFAVVVETPTTQPAHGDASQ